MSIGRRPDSAEARSGRLEGRMARFQPSSFMLASSFVGNATMLSQAQIERYRYDGYLFPLPALSPAELADCNADLARYEAWLGGPVNQAERRWRSASYVVLPWVDALTRHPQ